MQVTRDLAGEILHVVVNVTLLVDSSLQEAKTQTSSMQDGLGN